MELDEEDYLDNDGLIEDSLDNPPMDRHEGLLTNLTNFEPFLREKYSNWSGMVWDEVSQRFKKDVTITPCMNQMGSAWCVGFLRTYTRSNNIITDIKHEDYKAMMGDIITAIWLNLGIRSEEFGIKSDGDLLRVCNEMEHAAELVLMGAGDGKYNKFLGTTVSRSESISLNPNVQRQDDNTKFVRGGSIFNRIADKMRRV